MKLELLSAANFLVHLIRLAKRGVSEDKLQRFRESIIEVLLRRYRNHWFPEKPFKGSGYRCVRINGRMDPVIAQAGDNCDLSPTFLHSTFPSELTMWIDPLEVTFRIGENGSICELYKYCEGVTKPWSPACFRKNETKERKLRGCEWILKCLRKKTPVAPDSPISQVAVNEQDPPSDPQPFCKDSLRMDYLLDPKKSVCIEQLASLVTR